MGAQQQPVLALGLPANDDVRHVDVGAIQRMPGPEPLELDPRAQLLEMVGQQFLLGGHGGRPAGPRADRHKLLQVLVGPSAVERDVFKPQGDAVRPRRRCSGRWPSRTSPARTTMPTASDAARKSVWPDMRRGGARVDGFMGWLEGIQVVNTLSEKPRHCVAGIPGQFH